MVSDRVQTIVRIPLPNAEFPVTAIAMAGSKKRPKQHHGLERMSRELATVVQRFKTFSPTRPRRHFTIWSAVQREPRLRSRNGQPGWGSETVGHGFPRMTSTCDSDPIGSSNQLRIQTQVYFSALACLLLTGCSGFGGGRFATRILPARIARVKSSKSFVVWSA